jgi:TonB family protein
MNIASTMPGILPAACASRPSSARVAAPVERDGGKLLPVFTLILWVGCLVIGGLGFLWAYPRPLPAAARAEPIKAEFLHVELERVSLPVETLHAMVNPIPTPEPPPALATPQIALPMLVAEPSPAIAFALPVEGPSQIVEPRRASYSAPAGTEFSGTSTPMPVQTLTYGHGEGKQPAPDYPLQARRQRQQGTVKVHLAVGSDGRVLSAEAVEPSPWPLLNDSAIRAVRERWRFSGGQPRLFEVLIRFQLGRHLASES